MAGEFGNFDPSTYHFSDADLQQIINKTQDAINEMNTVNNTVQAHTDSLVDANRSDSGQILSGHLTTWTSDFHTCVNNLTDLNHKAQALLQINRGTNNDATGGAR
ncbi:hypothetical protein [Actinoallomurus iriomotensis]|uniref:Uncharacterized protein n=1 Tax=Actinoallomurus iriomotensis TaxID=478107 RepID=A0A9W6RIU8_9ACTN|nr:hypothetical protein [Actinoallomurus iriomotensis]GLY74847.1 hypothetical protein Airi01_031140 [Actinoallomurus iriomotensis]